MRAAATLLALLLLVPASASEWAREAKAAWDAALTKPKPAKPDSARVVAEVRRLLAAWKAAEQARRPVAVLYQPVIRFAPAPSFGARGGGSC